MRLILRVIIAGSMLAAIGSSLSTYPHSLAYFNELAGGPRNGHKVLIHSNLDWGQGLLELDRALDCHPEWGPVGIAYSGPFDPDSIGCRAIPIHWSEGELDLSGFSHIAISANILVGDPKASAWYHPPTEKFRQLAELFGSQEAIDNLDCSLRVFDTRAIANSLAIGRASKKSLPTAGLAPSRRALPLPSLSEAADAKTLNIAGLAHVLLLNGLGYTGLDKPASGAEALRLLTDERFAKAVFGESPFVRTSHGLRYRLSGRSNDEGTVGESHRDQCLSAFASLDLPLTYPIILENESCKIQDLLLESVANFTYDQSEIPWTALAFSHYLPPARQWTDRFGKLNTFSDLANHLVERGFAAQSCAGLHVLDATVELSKIDSRCGILDRAARIKTHRFVRDAIRHALVRQHADGSWGADWYEVLQTPGPGAQSLEFRIVVTGHLLEVFQKCQEPVPNKVIARAAGWLLDSLDQVKTAGRPKLMVCPLTHAVRALRFAAENRSHSHEIGQVFARYQRRGTP